MGIETPKTKFDILLEEMKKDGFNYYGKESLFQTQGTSGKGTTEGFKFITKQIQTTDDIINNYKNKPEFSEVKHKVEIKLVQLEKKENEMSASEEYYVFIKILE